MGLDMYLYARKYVGTWRNEDSKQRDDVLTALDLEIDDLAEGGIYIDLPVAQWRKAHKVHGWLVSKVQDGEDNCADYYIDRDTLNELREWCLDNVDQGGLEDPDQLQRTADLIEKILGNSKFHNLDFTYTSSW
jgi:hypothetical protein